MDEATANVDMQTDEYIQKGSSLILTNSLALRLDFKDATVITVAHRLNTIIDYDRIAVFDQGSIVEFGSPKDLLSYAFTFLTTVSRTVHLHP
jgi:ABC-type multidrug transport system fused ATPase/permease subunit